MEKLLHELLRVAIDEANGEGVEDVDVYVGNVQVSLYLNGAQALVDEIERTYAALPRFDNGEPVSKGCEVDGGIVDGWCVWNDGAFSLNDEEGNILQEADPGECVKRPIPKVYDADGVEIKVGDTVYECTYGNEVVVRALYTEKGEQYIEWESNSGSMGDWKAKNVTHEKPVFDAEGARICKGDTVWHKDSGNEFIVRRVEPFEVFEHVTKITSTWFKPEEFTHREPDSLEKLRDRMTCKWNRAWAEYEPITDDELHGWIDDIAAIIERGA